MADPQQPMSEQSGIPGAGSTPDPTGQLRAWLQAQQSATTQMGPSMSHTQTAQPQPYQRQNDGSATQPGKKASLQHLTSSIQNLVGQVTQKIQQRKATDQQHVFDRFTQSVQGIQSAQSQLQEAQAALKENPQDQQALQKMQQAQQALQINRTNLDAMFNGPQAEKHSKMLSKGFGIDDKNAQTPERQAAMQAIRKSMGVGQGAAGIISQLPQTMQQTPGAQQIKPPTGDAMLRAQSQQRGQDIKAQTDQMRMAYQQGVGLDKLKMTGLLKGIDVSKADNGELVTHVMSPEERAKVPYLKAQDDLTAAKTEAQRAMADAKMNPNNPEMKIKMMDAQSKAVDANARMLAAQAAQMRAMTAQAKEPPEVMQARRDLSKFNEDLAKTQLAISQQNSGFFGGGKYDENKAQAALATIQNKIKSSQSVIDNYTAKQPKESTSDEDILKGLDDLDK